MRAPSAFNPDATWKKLELDMAGQNRIT
jgi:hypothetical protein